MAAHTYRWIAVGYGLAAAILTVWTIGLAVTMLTASSRHIVTWVGLDIGLIFAFCVAGWLAHRRDPRLGLVAAASGTAVLLDAWFDVTTAAASWLPDSLFLAVAVELPFVLVSAAIAGWAYYRSSTTTDGARVSGDADSNAAAASTSDRTWSSPTRNSSDSVDSLEYAGR
jgi:hypothetical protein